MSTKIRVLIGDNHTIFCAGLRSVVTIDQDIQISGEITATPQIYSWSDELPLDVVLIAANLPSFALPDTVIEWSQRFIEAKTLALLRHEDEVCSRRLVESGTSGCLLKSDTVEEFIQAIHTVVQGKTWFRLTQLQKSLQSQIDPPLATTEIKITAEEQTILRLIAAEKTNKQIALTLGVSNRTANNYLTTLFHKLGVQTRVGALAQAFQRELLP